MSKHKQAAAPKPLDLDLRPGQSIELLKELHILTRAVSYTHLTLPTNREV